MRSSRDTLSSLAASPTMVGAITTLIVVVAVFLAYNANNGLPFVPVYRISAEICNAARLGPNNEVRIGGNRVGVVESIETTELDDPTACPSASAGTEPRPRRKLNLKLDKAAEPLPADSTIRVRYRSSFGLKYLEIERGDGDNGLQEGGDAADLAGRASRPSSTTSATPSTPRPGRRAARSWRASATPSPPAAPR